MTSVEIKASIADMVTECRSIVEAAKHEVRELTEEEKARFEELKQQIDEKKAELQKLQAELDSLEIPDEELKSEEEEKEEEKDEKNKEENRMKNFNLFAELREAINTGKKITIPCTENRAAVDVATNGAHVVETEVADILMPLRANNVLVQAGAQFMTGLVGDQQIPVMGKSQCAWAGETVGAEDGAPTYSHVKVSPKRLTTYVDVSLKFIAQDSKSAMEKLQNDLIASLSEKLEATILGEADGEGGTAPVGLRYNKTGEEVQVTDFKSLAELEAKLEEANVNNYSYILSPKAKAFLRAMAKSAKNTQLVLENGEVDGTQALSTSNLAANKFLIADWSNLVIAQFGDIELDVVRDSTSLKKGCVTIVVNAYFDAAMARPDAIVYGKTTA